MSQIITIIYADDEKEKIENINDISFVDEYMIICMSDLKTRLVRQMRFIIEYKLVEQPVKKVIKKK